MINFTSFTTTSGIALTDYIIGVDVNGKETRVRYDNLLKTIKRQEGIKKAIQTKTLSKDQTNTLVLSLTLSSNDFYIDETIAFQPLALVLEPTVKEIIIDLDETTRFTINYDSVQKNINLVTESSALTASLSGTSASLRVGEGVTISRSSRGPIGVARNLENSVVIYAPIDVVYDKNSRQYSTLLNYGSNNRYNPYTWLVNTIVTATNNVVNSVMPWYACESSRCREARLERDRNWTVLFQRSFASVYFLINQYDTLQSVPLLPPTTRTNKAFNDELVRIVSTLIGLKRKSDRALHNLNEVRRYFMNQYRFSCCSDTGVSRSDANFLFVELDWMVKDLIGMLNAYDKLAKGVKNAGLKSRLPLYGAGSPRGWKLHDVWASYNKKHSGYNNAKSPNCGCTNKYNRRKIKDDYGVSFEFK